MKVMCLLVSALAISQGQLRAADNLQATRYGILHHDGRALELIDGVLYLCVAISNEPDPMARQYESRSDLFDVEKTDNGYLVRVRPGLTSGQGRKNLDLDNFYLTADYSKDLPSLRFTKSPEKYSYWDLPEIGGHLALHGNPMAGPITNRNDSGKKAYLTISTESESLRHPLTKGHWEYSRVCLSDSHSDDFKVQRLNPKDEGK